MAGEGSVRIGVSPALLQFELPAEYRNTEPLRRQRCRRLFSSLTFVDWLAYNETQRLDDDPLTGPLTLEDFRMMQAQGIDDAGITLDPSANPFQIDNQWNNVLTIDQVIYDGAVFSGIKGAKVFRDISEAESVRQAQLVVNQVKVSFFSAIFASEQSEVVRKSVQRTSRTVTEARQRLIQGVASKYDMLSAEVEMVNLESDLVRVENVLQDALDALKMLLGLPMEQLIVLRGNLDNVEADRLVNISLEDAVNRAIAQRLDLEQAALSIELQRINESIQKSSRYPTLRGFVNAGYVGSVPSNRQVVFTTDDPFTYDSVNLGFFDGSYWNATASVGLTLKWNIFDGRQTHANIQRARIEQQRAEIVYDRPRLDPDAFEHYQTQAH